LVKVQFILKHQILLLSTIHKANQSSQSTKVIQRDYED